MSAILLRCLAMAAVAVIALSMPAAQARTAESANIGREVGDGNVLFDIPYDPKHVSEMLFLAPTPRHPYYEVVIPFGDWTEGKQAAVTAIRVNGTPVDSYYLFADGFSRVHGAWLTHESETAPNVVLVARALWHDGESTRVEVDVKHAGGEVTRTFTGTAPASGGGPRGWRRYQTLALHEKDGLAREDEPVDFTLTVRAEDCEDLSRELRLFAQSPDGDGWLPQDVQTFNAKHYPGTPPGTSEENYLFHPSKSLEGVFLATVPAGGSRVYLFVYDHPGVPEAKPAETDLQVTGPSLGATVENEHYVVRLDERSGQIASFDVKGGGEVKVPRLTNSYSYAVHWNPDSFSDNGLWGHTFGWDPPDEVTVSARGPLMFRVTCRGRMPDSTPQVYASVTYSFYARVPYVKVSTVTEVRDPLNANAIRNGEIVLDSHLITHFVWQEKNGDLRILPTLHGPNWQDEWSTRLDHDVPWVAMTHEIDGYGIGAITEHSLAFSPNRGEATVHRPAYYLYYHHMWQIPVTYFTRGWMYPFSDYQRGPNIPVDPGSTYVERMAFMPFFLHEGGERYRDIEGAARQVRNPLSQRWGR